MHSFKTFIVSRMQTTKVLVLGFYDRSNTGDELYKHIIPRVIDTSNFEYTFKCTDDLQAIPPGIDIVICGGGEIINKYFMTKILTLIGDFAGPIYAVSVNLSSENDIKYLNIFDHVFMRSLHDYNLAKEYLGERNCTYLPDISYTLPKIIKTTKKQTSNINIGVALAQPVFYQKPTLLHAIITVLTRILEDDCNVFLHFFNFNSHLANYTECDVFLNEQLISNLPKFAKQRYVTHYNSSPIEIYKTMGEMNFNICMRYHSVMFSLLNKVPFVALYKSRKVDMLLSDVHLLQHNYKIDNDIDADIFYSLLKIQIESKNNVIELKDHYFDVIKEHIKNRKLQAILTTSRHHTQSVDVVLDNVNKALEGKDNWNTKEKAKLICYIVTGDSEHPCLWGLTENMSMPLFNLESAVKYIAGTLKCNGDIHKRYYPVMKTLRTCLLDVDPLFNNEFDGVHRSGWKYVVGGLMNLDGGILNRQGKKIILDTYVDRTFLWGYNSVASLGLLPYKSPWIGIIHHTFDESHSLNNCNELFDNVSFIQSLAVCKGLITMSEYLAGQVRDALEKCEKDIMVHVVYHPTEFVKNVFTFDKFMSNKHKKVIQIGAWLRDAYAIYKLPIEDYKNTIAIRKAVLCGKDMSSAFKEEHLFEDLQDVLCKVACTKQGISRGKEVANKYNIGLYNNILQNHESVEVIPHVSDEKYDELLSENIVFLKLVDCSAVNTVIECIVRNTPIIVNRHPALEEVLGAEYPGFYTTCLEAVHKITSEKKLRTIYQYLTKMDKTKLRLNTFLRDIQRFFDFV